MTRRPGAAVPQVALDRAALIAELDALEIGGARIECRTSEDRRWWHSPDIALQRKAARKCDGCPALEACAEFGLTYPYMTGVYGGRTESDRMRYAKKKEKDA